MNPELDQFLRPKDSLARENDNYVPGYKFQRWYEPRTSRIRVSRVDITHLVALSNVGSASATVTTGQFVTLQSTFRLNRFNGTALIYGTESAFSIPLVSVYQGTVNGTAEIFPYLGSGISVGAYRPYGGLNFGRSSGGSITVWSGVIENVSAGTQNIIFLSQWKYIDYNSITGGQT